MTILLILSILFFSALLCLFATIPLKIEGDLAFQGKRISTLSLKLFWLSQSLAAGIALAEQKYLFFKFFQKTLRWPLKTQPAVKVESVKSPKKKFISLKTAKQIYELMRGLSSPLFQFMRRILLNLRMELSCRYSLPHPLWMGLSYNLAPLLQNLLPQKIRIVLIPHFEQIFTCRARLHLRINILRSLWAILVLVSQSAWWWLFYYKKRMVSYVR